MGTVNMPLAILLQTKAGRENNPAISMWTLGDRATGRCKSCIAARALFAVTLMAGVALPAQTSGSAPPILIGVSNVQSGPSRALGQNLMAGSMAYFDVVNSTGGVNGARIKVVLKDDRYEPDPAVQNTNDLILKDRVFVLFDYVGTPTLTRVLPLLKFYEETEIVNVAPFTGADPQRRPPYDKFVFNIRASYREETRALVEYFLAKGYRRIAFVGQADAYGKSGEIGVAEALASHNLTIVEGVTYHRNQPYQTSMQPQVDALKAKGAEAIIMVGAYAACGAFIRDARLGGWDVPIANVSFVGADAMLALLVQSSAELHLDLTAKLINSQVVPSPDETSYPLVTGYRAAVKKEAAGFVSLEGWLNAVVLVEALRRAGPGPSRADFIRAMESLHSWDPGLGLKLDFSTTSHQAMHKVWLTRTDRGRWVPGDAEK
jgi:branched-chain amino acid transport system substrate-binding protein